MKFLWMGMVSVLIVNFSAHAITVGDTAGYVSYSSDNPAVSSTQIKTVTYVDSASGDFVYNFKVDENLYTRSEGGGNNKLYESALKNCSANELFSEPGIRESITTPAGTFNDACHYYIYDPLGIKREVYIGKVPFYIIAKVSGSTVQILVSVGKSR